MPKNTNVIDHVALRSIYTFGGWFKGEAGPVKAVVREHTGSAARYVSAEDSQSTYP
jgi:hypothetical protein